MRRNIIIITLVLAFLIFGCTMPGQGTEETQQVTQPGTPPNQTPPTQPGTPPQQEPEEPLDLSGLEYAAIMALGIPVECTVTIDDDGTSVTGTLYVVSEDEFSWEFYMEEMEEYNCTNLLFISKEDMVYFGCEGGKYPPAQHVTGLCLNLQKKMQPNQKQLL
ncbi:hypothetical protein KKB44_05485 [Candidatus Micrarchaeota archaeon]|nr:hypothetical protein [Candidatus Micrarchaeota archaeon]